jgi:ABC-type multidrug transport system fused ATPase/permease subunit
MIFLTSHTSIALIFREFLRRYPRQFAVLFAVLVIEGLVAAGAVLSILPLMDFLLDPALKAPSRITQVLLSLVVPLGIVPGFWIFGLIFVGANLIKGLFDVAIRYAILRIKYDVQRGLFADAINSFFRARWAFFSQSDQGKLLNTFNKELGNIGDTLGQLATQLARAVQLCIYLAVPLWLSPEMTFTAIGTAILLGSPLLLLQQISYRFGQKNIESANILIGTINETLSAARLIIGFGRQKKSQVQSLKAFDQHVHATLRSQTLDRALPAIYQPIGILSAVIALGVAHQQGENLAEMAALIWSLLRMLPILGELMSSAVAIKNFLPSYEQLVSLHTQAEKWVEIEGADVFKSLKNEIKLKNVNFTYPGRQQTLHDIDVTIKKGQMTAFIGESGSGKSTITDLVLGLQVPDSGLVLLDDVPLGHWNQNSFRERVGYVPQEPLLFHLSIRENLLWSCPQASELDLWAACDMANVSEFIKELPHGIDTIVGERGVRLSGGQRQRVALARALIRKPELLILDEATSALDSESERLIQAAIDKIAKKTTVIIIAHRLSTIANADYIYVISQGRVVEEGEYGNLSCNLTATY